MSNFANVVAFIAGTRLGNKGSGISKFSDILKVRLRADVISFCASEQLVSIYTNGQV